MSDTMLTRLARVLYLQENSPLNESTLTHWEQINQDAYYHAVCAILTALRSPTEGMRLAVARSIGQTVREENHMVRADHAIRALVDYLLNEGK